MKRALTYQHDVLDQTRRIPWVSGYMIARGTQNTNWSFSPDELFLGDDWYLEKYEIISQAPANSAIIDVGCHKGDWIKRINKTIPSGVKYLGIDPIHYPEMDAITNSYSQYALANVDQETTMTFNMFDEPGCNSLLLKSDHLTMRNVIGKIEVKVKSLEAVLLENFNSDTIIHYLKCDCQGTDVDVVKSLRSFIPHTKYVQIECSFDYKQPFYKTQPSYEDDVAQMLELGFEPIFYMEYDLSPLPEGEILFRNKKFIAGAK